MLSLYTLQPELMKLKSSRFSGDPLKVRTLSLPKTLRMSLMVRSETKTGWSSILFDDMDSVMLVTGYSEVCGLVTHVSSWRCLSQSRCPSLSIDHSEPSGHQPQPIRGQCPGHEITIDQSEARDLSELRGHQHRYVTCSPGMPGSFSWKCAESRIVLWSLITSLCSAAMLTRSC